MKSLAAGKNSDTIFKLIKVLINTQQEDFKVAIQGDTGIIQDVCSQIETDRELFAAQEVANGTVYNKGFESPEEDGPQDEDFDQERAMLSPQPYADVEKTLPTKSLILGVNGNETVNQINNGTLTGPDVNSVRDLKQHTGWRSTQFNFLLDEAPVEKPTASKSQFLEKLRQRKEV